MDLKQNKIIHVIDSLGRGGAETLLVGAIKTIPDYKHIIVTLKSINDFEEETEQYEIISLGFKGILSIPRVVVALSKIIQQQQPDLIHSHLYWSSVIARMATPKNIKLYFSNHTVQSREAFKRFYYVWLERLTYKSNHHLISVSNEVKKDYARFVSVFQPNTILYNYVEDEFFKLPSNINKERLQCIAVGRNCEAKNYPFLVQNFPTDTGINLSVFGKDYDGSLSRWIEQRERKNIFYKGVTRQLAQEIKNYDVFIMSSIYEGQPVSVLEAMASGLPVVLSDIPVLREVAGEAGIYFDLEDPLSLSKVFKEIKNGTIDLNQKAKLAYQRAEKIARKEKYIQKLISLYKS